jgi:hypothetical protein
VFTGLGVFLGPLCVAVLAAGAWHARSERARSIAFGAAATGACFILLLFLRGYQFNPAVDCFVFPWPRPWEYVPFVGFIEGQPMGLRPGPRWGTGIAAVVGIALLLGAVWATLALWRRSDRSGERSVTFVLVGFSALFALNAAVGRICLGPIAAASSRYVPYAIPLLLAAYLVMRTRPAGPLRTTGLACFALLVVMPHLLAAPYRRHAEVLASGKRRWVACYLRSRSIEACDAEARFAIYPWPGRTHLKEKLDKLERARLSFFAPGGVPR